MCYKKNSTEYWFLMLMDEYAVLAATSHHLDWDEFSFGTIYLFCHWTAFMLRDPDRE